MFYNSIPSLCRWRPTVGWSEWSVGYGSCRCSWSNWRSQTVDVRPQSPAERKQNRSYCHHCRSDIICHQRQSGIMIDSGPVLIKLHWLPVCWRVQYKLQVLVFSALHGLAPGYIHYNIVTHSDAHQIVFVVITCTLPLKWWEWWCQEIISNYIGLVSDSWEVKVAYVLDMKQLVGSLPSHQWWHRWHIVLDDKEECLAVWCHHRFFGAPRPSNKCHNIVISLLEWLMFYNSTVVPVS